MLSVACRHVELAPWRPLCISGAVVRSLAAERPYMAASTHNQNEEGHLQGWPCCLCSALVRDQHESANAGHYANVGTVTPFRYRLQLRVEIRGARALNSKESVAM